MPLCGFNDKMLKSLASFNEGLIEHGIIFRSRTNDETINQTFNREISDMKRFLPEIDKLDDDAKKLLTEGLVKYAMGFYLIMRKYNIKEYKDVVNKINNFFYFMDDKYYGELEGKPNDMKELAESLNKKEI